MECCQSDFGNANYHIREPGTDKVKNMTVNELISKLEKMQPTASVWFTDGAKGWPVIQVVGVSDEIGEDDYFTVTLLGPVTVKNQVESNG